MSSFVRSWIVGSALVACLSSVSCSGDALGSEAMAAGKVQKRSGPPVVRLSKTALANHPIATVAAGPGALRSTFRAPARVEFDADARAAVTSAVAGRVVELRARVGEPIEKGSVLLVVESRELGEAQRELLVQRSTAAAFAPVVVLAEQAHGRAKALFEESQGIAFAGDTGRLADFIAPLSEAGCRVSLFIGHDPRQIEAAVQVRAPVIELHTGAYCDLVAEGQAEDAALELAALMKGARFAASLGLEVHAGHGLSFATVSPFAATAEIRELNIGHFLISEAVFLGLDPAIREMRRLMDAARG